MLRIVLPKGSLEAQTAALFEAADLKIRRNSERDYHATVADPRIDRVSFLRPQEIPRYIEEGFFDIGITGRDWVEETGAKVEVVDEMAYTKTDVGGVVKIVLAVGGSSGFTKAADLKSGTRISTEYPNLTQRYFDERGIAVRIFLSYGATEAKVPEIVDAIVDVTETGSTLRSHGMRILDTILESPAFLVANPQAWGDQKKRSAIEELRLLLRGAIDARGRVLVKLNVAEATLQEVIDVLPAMKSPTVSQLSNSGFYAVETVVEKSKINTLIPELKAKGAEDIIELAITKMVS